MRAMLMVAICAGLLPGASAGAREPFFEQDPFDVITLNAANDHTVLKVEPLDLPNRRLPENPRRGEKLTVRLLDDPEAAYELRWGAIQKIDLFEQLVLQEANKLVAAARPDEAYDYFKFLEDKDPTLPGLATSFEDYLYEEAKASHLKKEYGGALAMLRELYGRNPERPNLDVALGKATDELVKQYRAKEDYRSMRDLLDNLAAWFPDHAVAAAWEEQLKTEAATRLTEARQAVQKDDSSAADRLIRQINHIWPELSGAEELARSLHKKHARVIVGVSQPAMDPQPGRLSDWAACRSSRLRYRTLTEFVRPDTEGGKYDCPVGKMTIEELERRITFELDTGIRWSAGEATLSGYDVSRRLLALADPHDVAYRADWAEIFGSVAVRQTYRVEVNMGRSHVRPDALLQTVLIPYTSPAAAEQALLPNGPYVLDAQADHNVRYRVNPQYFALKPTQPKLIVERHFSKGAKALDALQQRRIHVLDRVNPWLLDAVRADGNLSVEPYRLPLIHCLIPNLRKPFTAQRTFRRALVYGIHREAILKHLIGGAKLPGCQVVSGPFPPGNAFEDDPIGYAYDADILPRAYDPHLAVALARISLSAAAAAGGEEGKQLEQMPHLVLAHPAHEIAQVVCLSIQRQLKLIGIPIDLQELEGPLPEQIPEEVDLLYAELAIWEPAVDARRLLGEEGLTAGCSPYMSLALRRLDRATDWRDVAGQLHAIHRVAFNDVAVVPLWQLTDHLAYHKSLSGIESRPVTLYQNVERWQRSFLYPLEE